MSGRRFAIVVMVVLLAALVATACTTPTPEVVTEKVVETVVVEQEKEVKVVETVVVQGTPVVREVVVTATPEPVAVPAVEQVFTVAIGRDPGPLNPHDYDSQFVALSMIYEPLVVFQKDGTLGPGLAESWEVSADGLTYTFHIRQGVKFHDGTPLNAAAVKWNMDRWLADDMHSYMPGWNVIDAASVAVADEYTLVFNVIRPYYAVAQEFTLVRPVRILSPTGVDASGAFVSPIGTGPWKVSEYLPDQRTIFVRNEDYWGEKPKLERVVFEVIADPQTRIAALLSDEVDLVGGDYLGAISLESLQVLQRNPTVRLVTGPGATSLIMGMNFRQPPFDDPRVRHAVNYAIDRQIISEQLFAGLAAPAAGVFPLTNPNVTHPHPEYYAYDPDQARALLAEAGWTPGADGILEKDGQRLEAEVVIDADVLPQAKSMAEVIQAELLEVGINVTLRLVDFGAWSTAVRSGDYGMAMWNSYGPPYDPPQGLGSMFNYSKLGFADDGTIYADPALDPLWTAAFQAVDPVQRQAAYDQVWAYMDEQAVAAPIVYSLRLYAVDSKAQGFELSASEYEVDLANVVMVAR